MEELRQMVETIIEKSDDRITDLDIYCLGSYLEKSGYRWDAWDADKGWWIAEGGYRPGDPKPYNYNTLNTVRLYMF